ncbi:hypothetical protein ACIHAR_01845 [Streptomyces sp. NPDC052016]|uniref:hypothetical protein n=1 Tax=Streptomyces sp. NPDC052016 TaxID=3365680 RepID=UPI0037D6C0A2
MRVGNAIGALIGAAPGQTVAGDSTSVQLFTVLDAAAALRPDRPLLVTDPGHFPAGRYLADAVARRRGLRVRRVPPADRASSPPRATGSPSSATRPSTSAPASWTTCGR